MSPSRRDTTFVVFLVLSLFLHLGILAVVLAMGKGESPPRQQAYIVDLQDLPLPPTKSDERQVSRIDDQTRRVIRERAPRGDDGRDASPAAPARPVPPPPNTPRDQKEGGTRVPPRTGEPLRGEGLFRPRRNESSPPPAPRLLPGAERLAQLEEVYRRKFHEDVAEGDAHFVNTDDIRFGSFLRRFETAVYGVWRYPEEAARLGVEGVVPTKIVFNRQGEIVKVEILESSGSRLLDNEVLRTLNNVGVIGGFPRNYDRETYTLIAFFHYGIRRGEFRSIR